MSPLPAQFTDRWGGHPARPSYEDSVCWHLLLGGHAGVQAAAADAQQRLARFSGLHMTPRRWLHVTVLRAGPADRVSRGRHGARCSPGPRPPSPGPRRLP